MASERDDNPVDRRDFVQNPDNNMSTPTSPTDARHPLARVESISEQLERDGGLSESYQSTETIRRRPDTHSVLYPKRSFEDGSLCS